MSDVAIELTATAAPAHWLRRLTTGITIGSFRWTKDEHGRFSADFDTEAEEIGAALVGNRGRDLAVLGLVRAGETDIANGWHGDLCDVLVWVDWAIEGRGRQLDPHAAEPGPQLAAALIANRNIAQRIARAMYAPPGLLSAVALGPHRAAASAAARHDNTPPAVVRQAALENKCWSAAARAEHTDPEMLADIATGQRMPIVAKAAAFRNENLDPAVMCAEWANADPRVKARALTPYGMASLEVRRRLLNGAELTDPELVAAVAADLELLADAKLRRRYLELQADADSDVRRIDAAIAAGTTTLPVRVLDDAYRMVTYGLRPGGRNSAALAAAGFTDAMRAEMLDDLIGRAAADPALQRLRCGLLAGCVWDTEDQEATVAGFFDPDAETPRWEGLERVRLTSTANLIAAGIDDPVYNRVGWRLLRQAQIDWAAERAAGRLVGWLNEFDRYCD